LFPRFFGITKTLRPVFSPAAADDEDDAPEVAVEPDDGLELEELHAASRTDAITRGTARLAVCLSCMC
jgi:hypothetical protein